jgi:thiol-disulfide isomerase/thioredoxin
MTFDGFIEGHDMTIRLAAVSAAVLALLVTGRPAWSSEIAWRRDVAAAARESAAGGKPLLVMVEASWCGPCQRMLRQTFPDPVLAARINAGFIPLLIDVDQQAALVQKLNINAFPTMLVLDPSQRVVERVTGFQTAAQLNSRLAVLQPTQTRITQRPIEVAQSPRPAPPQPAPFQPAPFQPAVRTTSFHDRVWASIRSSSFESRPDAPRNAAPAPSPSPLFPAPRDTFTAAKDFSEGK